MGHGVRKENISRFSDAYTWRGVGGTWKRVESFPLIWAGEQVWDKLMVWRGRGHAGSQLPRGGGGSISYDAILGSRLRPKKLLSLSSENTSG